ncbi:MAG: alpha/beta fold hydrolase [Planctomycetota bacterium]
MQRVGLTLLVTAWIVVASCGEREPAGDVSCRYATEHGLRAGRVDAPGGAIYYETEGTGPPLVLVHGHATHGIFHPVLSELAASFTLVYFDRRAFGRTPADTETMPNVLTDVEDVERLREALGLETFHLLGLSDGGPVVLEYALAHPERVRRLVLLSTYAHNAARTEAAWKLLEDLVIARQERMDATSFDPDPTTREIEEYLLLPHPQHHGPLARETVAFWIETGVLGTRARDQRSWRLDDVARSRNRMTDLGRIASPTLVLCGRHDAITPLAHAEAMAQALPDGRLLVLENAGHLAFAEVPEPFVAAVRAFLEE